MDQDLEQEVDVFMIKSNQGEYNLQIQKINNNKEFELMTINQNKSKLFKETFSLSKLTEKNRKFGMYDVIDDIVTDLIEAVKSADGIFYEQKKKIFSLKMKVVLNNRMKFLGFDLQQTKITDKETNVLLRNETVALMKRFKDLESQQREADGKYYKAQYPDSSKFKRITQCRCKYTLKPFTGKFSNLKCNHPEHNKRFPDQGAKTYDIIYACQRKYHYAICNDCWEEDWKIKELLKG